MSRKRLYRPDGDTYDLDLSLYPPLDVRVVTPALELRGATDDLLERLAPLVRAGEANADPPPWDDPCSFYEENPDKRVEAWLRATWRNRGTVRTGNWRLSFAVVVDDEPIGVQDLTGRDFDTFGMVETTSWVSADVRQRGIGTETRSAILHLAFEGLGAAEAHSEAAFDNEASNRISERLGYERNGTSWATHQGRPVLGQRWLLHRSTWESRRRPDITMFGVEAARASLGID